MARPRSALVVVLAFALLSAGCSKSGSPTAAGTTSGATSTPARASAAASSSAAAASSSDAGQHECAKQSNYVVTISQGDISCADAYVIAAGFDPVGAQSQDQGPYTCEFAHGASRPTVFSCSGTAGVEFSVAETQGPQDCPQTHAFQIKIVSGENVGCTDVNRAAARFDLQGDAVQTVEGYTCQLGTASTRPTVFTCSDSGTEFAVNQP